MPMDFYWVYDLPNWLFATLTIAAFVAFSMVGLWISRPLLLRTIGRHPHNDIVSFYLSTAGVFYGITLGLIAVGTYTTFSEVEKGVSREAASLASLYLDISSYPEPARSQLRGQIQGYLRYVIEDEWPRQKDGIVGNEGIELVRQLHMNLYAFNPSSEREKIAHAEAVQEFNELVQLNGIRLQSVATGLPATMYVVVVIGALLNIVISWLFFVENFKLHGLLNVLMAALLGLLVFLIAAMDNPFRGEYSVGPDAFIFVRDRLMTAPLMKP